MTADEEAYEEPVITIKVVRIAPRMNLFDVFEASPGIPERKVCDAIMPEEVDAYLADFSERAWW